MFYELYEKHIKDGISVFPAELCLMLTGGELAADTEKLISMLHWVQEFPAIQRFIIHISAKSADVSALVSRMAEHAAVRVSTPDGEEICGSGPLEVLLVVGNCGRKEIADAVLRIAAEGLRPEDITAETLESHLRYQVTPDFVIKTGGNHLTDFLIWQSVYSELFFCDVNWAKFRRVDFLRALRDFQSRQRRFGK